MRFEGQAEEVEVEELTSDGCRIRSVNKFEPFAAVSIGLAGIGHTPGRLVSCSGDLYNCAFERQLPATAATQAVNGNIAYLPVATQPRAVVPGGKVIYSLRAGWRTSLAPRR